jgi:hypothetical protein
VALKRRERHEDEKGIIVINFKICTPPKYYLDGGRKKEVEISEASGKYEREKK